MKYPTFNQKINNAQQEIRRKQFIYDLIEFLKSQNKTLNKIPILGHRELDLMSLYNEVQTRGGFDEVNFSNLLNFKVVRKKQWHSVVKALHLPSSCTNAAFALRTHYLKFLKDYEEHKAGKIIQENEDSDSKSLSESEDTLQLNEKSLKRKEFSEESCKTSSKKYKLVIFSISYKSVTY